MNWRIVVIAILMLASGFVETPENVPPVAENAPVVLSAYEANLAEQYANQGIERPVEMAQAVIAAEAEKVNRGE